MELSYANNPKSLFRKYAKLVTWFSNTEIGKDFLNLSHVKDKIYLLTPTAYHTIKEIRKDDVLCEAVFSTDILFARKLYPALSLIDKVASFYKSFEAMQKQLVWLLGLSPLSIKRRYMATSTFNPQANPETTCGDYDVYRNPGTNDTWNQYVTGVGTGVRDTTNTTDQRAHANATGAANTFQQLFRMGTLFDTSSLTNKANISAATWSQYIGFVDQATQVMNWRLVSASPASNTSYVASDYINFGTTGYAADVAVNFPTAAYKDITLNATGIAAIAKTGITKIGVRLVEDINNTAPTWAAAAGYGAGGNSADNASNKPKLTVTYSLPGGGGFLLDLL